MNTVTEVKHPLVAHALGFLRDEKTSIVEYRYYSDRICSLLVTEGLNGLHLKREEIATPVATTTVLRIKEDIVIIPVLRAGLAMLYGALQLLPQAKIGFVGLERDENTAVAREYYWKLPSITENTIVLITDPMLATGGSLKHVLKQLQKSSPKEIRVISVISAPEGIQAIHEEFPHVKIITASIDSHLNDKKYIVPGLGDYGDRYFGT